MREEIFSKSRKNESILAISKIPSVIITLGIKMNVETRKFSLHPMGEEGGGGVHWISSGGDDRKKNFFWFEFFDSGIFSVGKFDKYSFMVA